MVLVWCQVEERGGAWGDFISSAKTLVTLRLVGGSGVGLGLITEGGGQVRRAGEEEHKSIQSGLRNNLSNIPGLWRLNLENLKTFPTNPREPDRYIS